MAKKYSGLKIYKIGDKIGNAEIIGEEYKGNGYSAKYYICRCGCGEIFSKQYTKLRKYPYCKKCSMEKRKKETNDKAENYIGQVINGYKIISVEKKQGNRKLYAKAICPGCKKEFTTEMQLIKRGIKRCGNCNKENLKGGLKLIKELSIEGTAPMILQKIIGGERALNQNNKSGFNGVCRFGKTELYRAYINFQRKQYSLGVYKNIEDAVAAREEAEKEIYGNFLEWYGEAYPEKQKKLNKMLNKTKKDGTKNEQENKGAE